MFREFDPDGLGGTRLFARPVSRFEPDGRFGPGEQRGNAALPRTAHVERRHSRTRTLEHELVQAAEIKEFAPPPSMAVFLQRAPAFVSLAADSVEFALRRTGEPIICTHAVSLPIIPYHRIDFDIRTPKCHFRQQGKLRGHS